MRIGLTGATGLIGRAVGTLAAAQGHSVVAYSRTPSRAQPAFAHEVRPVDVEAPEPLDASGLDVLIHLAGEPIFGFWTATKKQRIRHSRIDFTLRLAHSLASASPRPHTLLCASAIGIYGDRGSEELDETATAGDDFLAEVCKDWEVAALSTASLGLRVVHLRTGIVLANEGGALPLMRRAFRLGLGGRLGNGQQWMSWIHLHDEARIILWAAEHATVHGPLNLVAPNPVTNAEFTEQLAKALHRPAFMHAPGFALRLSLREMSSLVLSSQRVLPKLALAQGFHFDYPQLDGALKSLLTESLSFGNQS